MAQSSSDRNLFVGVLALQLSLVSEQQLLAAVKAWAFDKSRRLEDLFLEQQAIDERSQQLLRGLVDREQLEPESVQSPEKSDSRGFRESMATVRVAVEKLSHIEDEELRGSIADFLERTFGNAKTVELAATQALQDGMHGRRFRFLRPLAQGGLGSVSVAEDLELHREVALKQILPKYLGSQESRARFLVEAEVTGRLEHPGIVPVYSLGTNDSSGPFYAMQFIRGVSLAEAIDELHAKLFKLDGHTARLEIRKLIMRLIDACQAIQYAHSKGVLHRDIKPKNIMLGKFGETFVVDWGLARVGKGDSSQPYDDVDESVLIPSGSGSAATRLGSMIGTVEYMSPEQADGRLDELGPASDVFSLGATLYCILTGTYPTSANHDRRLHRLDYGRFLKPSQLNRAVPKALDAICMKALAVEIADRYRTVSGFLEDLESWLADEPVTVYAEPWVDRARRWLKEHRELAATLVGVLVTSILALSAFLVAANYNNRLLATARDHATANHRLARRLLFNELRADDELLSKNELTAGEIAKVRLRLAEGVYDTYERWYEDNPEDAELRNEFAFMARVLSNLKRSTSDFVTATIYIQRSLVAQEKQSLEEMSLAEKKEYITTLIAVGQLDRLEGRLSRALTYIDKALRLISSMAPGQYSEFEQAQKSIEVQAERATILLELGRYQESQLELEKGLAATDAALVRSSSDPAFSASWLNATKLNLALSRVRVLAENGSPEEARVAADNATEYARQFADSRKREFLYALLTSLNLAAQVRIGHAIELEKAASLLDEAEALIGAESPKLRSATLQEALSVNQRLRAVLHRQQNNLKEALKVVEQSHDVAHKLATSLPLPQYHLLEAEAAFEQATIHRALGDLTQADQWLEVTKGCLQKADERSPESARLRRWMLSYQNPTR